MKGKSDSHVVSSHDCWSPVIETSTHSPDSGLGCCSPQKPEIKQRKFKKDSRICLGAKANSSYLHGCIQI